MLSESHVTQNDQRKTNSLLRTPLKPLLCENGYVKNFQFRITVLPE